MDWKKNEIKILRNFACPECKVTVMLDEKIDEGTYHAYCPRCSNKYILYCLVLLGRRSR